MDDKLKLEAFESKSYDNKHSNSYSHYSTRYKKADPHTYASIKIGLCIAICIVLCIVNIATGSESIWISSENNDDAPGKLHFVELPGIIEVFAGGDKLTMPINEYTYAQLDENSNIVKFGAQSNATVVTCSSGTVKAIDKDEKYGNYVVVRHGDIETYYYGFGYITVEEKQIINKLDTLGLLTQSGVLYFKVQESGKAINPCDYLPIKLDK